ncbi:MAG: copper transporter [Acidimicrobiales bacterium]
MLIEGSALINLRYHIVSITAVFLALGIGLAFGAAFIDRATVGTLDANLTSLEGQNGDLEADNRRLEERIDAADAAAEEFDELGIPQLVDGRLADVPVLLIATRGVDEEAVDAAAGAVVAAGATFGGTLWLTERLTLADDGAREDLALLLGRDVETDAATLRTQLVGRLQATLIGATRPTPDPGVDEVAPDGGDPEEPTATTDAPPPPPAAPPPRGPPPPPPPPGRGGAPGGAGDGETSLDPAPRPVPPLVQGLLEGGFLELDAPVAPPAGFALLPANDARYLVVSGAGALVPDGQLLAPLVAAIAGAAEAGVPGGPVLVAAQSGPVAGAPLGDDVDPAAERVRFVGPLREAEGVRDRLSTVDNLEGGAGVLAAVLALERGILGQYGHYGVGEGAQSLLPAPPAPTAAEDEDTG